MGHTNKNPRKAPPRPPPTAPDNTPNEEQSTADKLALIKSQCQLAVAAMCRGNPAKAHRLMKDACLSHPDSPLVHAAQASLHSVEASMTASSDKQKQWRKVVESAQRAVSLSPNSILYGALHAKAMFNASRDVEGFEEAARECERALSIKNPVDPAEDTVGDLQEEMDIDQPVNEAVRTLGDLDVVRRPRVVEEFTVEERISGVREKLKLILGKCREASSSLEKNLDKQVPPKVVFEVAPVDRRPRKGDRNEIKNLAWEEVPESGSFRMSERKKRAFLEEIAGAVVKKDKWRKYWDNMSDERKRELVEIRVGDLREYCRSICKDGSAERVFSEAVGFAEKNRTWKFWGCYHCDRKFEDFELRLKHVEQEHKGEIGQKLKVKPFEFPEIDAEWADMLVNGPWEPVDTTEAIKMIEKQPKSQLGTLSDEDYADENLQQAQLLYRDPSTNRSPLDETLFGLRKCESAPSFLARACRNNQKWPLSDDMERSNLLQDIHRQFQVLVRDKFLTTYSLGELIKYAIEELHSSIPAASQLQSQGLGNSPLCICFLEVPQLKKILDSLHLLYEISGGQSADSKRLNMESIFLTGDSSCLFEDRLLTVEVRPHRHQNVVEDDSDGSATTCSICDNEVAVLQDIDAFTQWLFEGPLSSTADQLGLWTRLLDDMKLYGMEASKDFEEQFYRFENLRSKQRSLLGKYILVNSIETICANELENREQGGQHVPQSYESLVLELLAYEKQDPTSNLDAMIVGVLREARNILRLGVEAGLRSSELEDQKDASIRMAIQKEMEQKIQELRRIEEQITRNGGFMWRLLAIYNNISCDFRAIILPLVRNFLHAKLEALVNEEEKQKSDALAEELLSELALDTKKNTAKGNSDPKLSKKAKKKIKGLRKVKSPQATCGDELNVAQEETAEQAHFPEEFMKNFILEERKLEENLEYQRKVEDEAKQMALAEGTMTEAAHIKVEELTEPVVVCSRRSRRRRKKDTLQARKNLPLATIPDVEEDLGVLSTCSTLGTVSGSDIFNPGLRNDTGEYTCFVNVIVQVFWNSRKFREMFMSRSRPEHVHVGDPCVACALKEIFIALGEASAKKEGEAIPSTSLKNALIKLNPHSDVSREPNMYDTSDVLVIILDSLHESTVGSKCAEGSWDCGSDGCIAHELFGMDVHRKIICSNCGIESGEEKLTTFYYGIPASNLITIKSMQPESHFDEIFKIAERNCTYHDPQFACDPKIGGCGKTKSLLSYLRKAPHVFAISLLWLTDSESREDISATLTAFSTEIDMAVFHDGLDLGKKHSLFAMVCYFQKHHICFTYSHEMEKWIMYDDETVKEVGCWGDVISMCVSGRLQPRFLFFEAVN